jgi:hydrophobic/amphiphilic exporter-1 (mainly G- bacteria), HAE1 family
VRMPPGTTLARTDGVAALVEAELARLPEVRAVATTVGTGGMLGTPNAERANITLELVSSRERELSSQELAADLGPRLERALASFPEANVEVSAGGGDAVPVEAGIELVLSAGDRETLRERDEQAREIMRENPHLVNVGSSLEGVVSERVFVIDGSSLIGTGLTPSDVAQTLRAYNVGITAAQVREGGREIPVVVKVNPLYIQDEGTLLSLLVSAPGLGGYLPLSQLGRFEVRAAPTSISRANQAFTSTLSADIAPGAAGQLQLRAELEAAFRSAGVVDDQVVIGTGVGPDLLGDLVVYGPIAFFLALVLNYLVIASQFNSFRYPFYLLLTVPLALVGAFWLFYLTGSALDVISVLGVVILIGLVTKNAILLLDAVVSRVQEGLTLKEALVAAGRLRLRPILMTALTIVIISLPLLLGLGEGSEFRRSLGLVILGGVLSSTLLTLFVVPAAFYRFERRRYDIEAPQRSAAAEVAKPPLPPEPVKG